MAVDVKKQGYWIAMGVLALVAFVLYIVLVVLGVNDDLDKKTRTLQSTVTKLKKYASMDTADPVDGFPSKGVVEYWTETQKKLQEDVRAIEVRYKERAHKFQHIFGAGSNNEVDLAHFVQEMSDRVRQDLKEKYKSYFDESVTTFEKAVAVDQPRPQSETEIPFVQKKYYIAKDTLEAIESAVGKGKAQVSEIKVSDPAPVDPKAGPRTVVEIPVDLTVRMPAPDVGKLISALLKAQTALFEIHEVEAEPAPFSYPEFDAYKVFATTDASGQPTNALWPSFPKNVFIGVIDPGKPDSKGPLPEFTEPLVKVHVSYAALDFNFPAEKKAQ